MHVSVLEDPPALDQIFYYVVEKFVAAYVSFVLFPRGLYFGENGLTQAKCKFEGFLVELETLQVVMVKRLCSRFIFPRALEFVTRCVRLPIPTAHPAELVIAFSARHMLAPAIFLDRGAALVANLRVGDQPFCILSFTGALARPFLNLLTAGWNVRFTGVRKTRETDLETARAIGGLNTGVL